MEMTFDRYQTLARRTQNPALSREEHTLHAALGLASEAGEVAGIFQKVYQGHTVDRDAVIKEMGDVLWMLAELADAQGINLKHVAEANIRKLEKRYPDGFSAEHSLHREGES